MNITLIISFFYFWNHILENNFKKVTKNWDSKKNNESFIQNYWIYRKQVEVRLWFRLIKPINGNSYQTNDKVDAKEVIMIRQLLERLGQVKYKGWKYQMEPFR